MNAARKLPYFAPDTGEILYGLQLLPVVLPILFWTIYRYHKDRHLPDPVGSLVLAFGLGLLSAAISRGLYTALGWASPRYDAIALRGCRAWLRRPGRSHTACLNLGVHDWLRTYSW